MDDELFVCGEELRERLIALDFALLVYFWVGGLMFQILGVMGDLHAWGLFVDSLHWYCLWTIMIKFKRLDRFRLPDNYAF